MVTLIWFHVMMVAVVRCHFLSTHEKHTFSSCIYFVLDLVFVVGILLA